MRLVELKTESKQVALDSYYSAEDIRKRVKGLGKRISSDYSCKSPLLVVGILKGSFIFIADLVRELKLSVDVEFVAINMGANPGDGSRGTSTLQYLSATSLGNRNVLIVEDIVDSGRTLSFLKSSLRLRGTESICTCALINKVSHRSVSVVVDYEGFLVEEDEGFFVGYGLDLQGRFRNLPEICVVNYGRV